MITPVDQLWFMAHPERQYRLRQCTPAEIALWRTPPRQGHIAWTIIQREPAIFEQFSAPDAVMPVEDYDFELECLFDVLSRPPEQADSRGGGSA